MKSVGIDIGSFSVKIAEIDTTSKGFSLSRLQEFPLSQDPTRDRKIEVIELLRNTFNNYDPSVYRFVLCLRQNHVSSRVKRFPFRERHKILRSLAFELEDDLPFSPEDSIFEAKITKYFGNEAEVFALASPKERITEVLSLASDSGVDPDLLTSEGVALNNLIEPFLYPPREEPQLESPLPEPKSSQVILSLGHEHSVLVLLEEGTLKLIRHIDWGGRNLAESLSKAANIHYLEALKIMRKSALLFGDETATPEQTGISKSLAKGFEPLIQEMKLSLLECSADFRLDIKEIFICGGVANLRNINAFLTQQFGVVVNRILPLPLFPELNFETNTQGELSGALSIGLAIEGMRRPKNPAVQFLKNEFAKQSQSLQMAWDKWSYTLKIATATFALLLAYSYFKDDFASSAAEEAQTLLRSQASSIAGLKGPKATVKAIRDFLKEKQDEEKGRALSEKISELNQGLDVLNRLSSSLPGRRNLSVQISHMVLSGEILDLQGDVSSQVELATLKNTLTNLSSDSRLEVLSVKPQGGRVGFAFRLRMARLKGG